MENKRNEHLKIIREIAQVLAEDEVVAAEQEMRNHPDQFPAFHTALRQLDESRTKLEDRTRNPLLVDEFDSAHIAFADLLAIEAFLRGVLWGGKLYHTLTTR